MKRYTNKEAAAAANERVGFSFGENWLKYVDDIDAERIDEAKRSLVAAFAGTDLAGQSFLDIGSGSGLFSLAAHRLGATVTSLDVDPNSVACVQELRRREHSPSTWFIRQASILDAGAVADIEPAMRVYSWGVLHHTGAMWNAIESAMSLVSPGGLLALALYTRPRHLAVQMTLKRTYNRIPLLLRPLMVRAYALAFVAALLVRHRNPVRYVRSYSMRNRGMSFLRDVEDWLGGLPFEFTDEQEMRSFASRRGWTIERVFVRSAGGNNEYLLRRPIEGMTSDLVASRAVSWAGVASR